MDALTCDIIKSLNTIVDTDYTGDVDSINVKIFEERETLINQLTLLQTALPDIITRIDESLLKASMSRDKDLSAMDALLNKKKIQSESADPQSSPEWTTVVRGKTPQRSARNTVVRTAQAPAHTTVQAPAHTTVQAPAHTTAHTTVQAPAQTHVIKFTDALSLNNVRVLTFDLVKQDGNLYYVESADHFAFRLGGQLFHGNIGVIYTDEKNPGKIKDCRFSTSCMKQNACEYYHDPMTFPGSRDHRNFIASSWLYAPPNSNYKNKTRSRRFGSREHLDMDIVGLTLEEVTRFYDQSMHDFLCAMLLKKSTV